MLYYCISEKKSLDFIPKIKYMKNLLFFCIFFFCIFFVNFSYGQTPSNDEIQNATTINNLPFIDQFVRTDRATTESGGGMIDCDFSNVLTRVYYRYVPIQDESIMIGITDNGPNSVVLAYESSVEYATLDSQLTLFTGSECVTGSSTELDLVANKIYYFVISNPDSATHVLAISNEANSIINIPDANLKNALVNKGVIDLDGNPNIGTLIGDIDENLDVDINNDGEIQESEALFVTYLDISNEFSADESEMISDLTGIEYFSLEYLDVRNNKISNLQGIQGEALKTLFLDSNSLISLSAAEFPILEELSCSGNQLTSIDVSQNLMLQFLAVAANKLTSIDVTQNSLLTSLIFGENLITEIDLTKNQELNYLECVEGQLVDVDVAQNLKLNHIWVSYNELSSLDVSNNSNLEILWASNNNLSSLDITQNTNLRQMNILENNLTEIDVTNNSLLERLFVSNNNINAIDITQNPNLREFGCSGNNLSTLDTSQNPVLTYLACHTNQLTSLDITQNSVLRDLICHTNQLTSLDVAQNTDLKTLRLGSNPIQEIDITQNTSLDHFNSYGTAITNLDLSQNPNLNIVRVGNNYNLQSVNLKNGNNQNIASENFNSVGSPNLQTICVDELNYAINNFVDKEPLTFFIEDCSQNSISYNSIEGVLALDEMNDGCDPTDFLIPNIRVTTTDGTNQFTTFTDNSGFYRLAVGDNTYDISVSMLPDYVIASPGTNSTVFTDFGNTEVVDFCLTSTNNTIDDLEVVILPTNEARPGFQSDYHLVYKNKGITTLNGTVTFQFDNDKQSFESSVPNETSVSSNSVTFDYSNLKPFESRTIAIKMTTFTLPTVNDGDVLNFIASIDPIQMDQTQDNNTYSLDQVVVNSYDPNDKRVLQGTEIFAEETDEYLDYIVRFQNTGSASAINVRITDRLNDKLDWNTIEPVSASHEYRVQITNGNFVEFIFEGINLPAEQDDQEGSNGFVAFRIKPENDVTVGDIIEGEANIYFDFNPPIITNIVSTEVVELLDVEEFTPEPLSVVLYPNPVNEIITIQSKNLIESLRILDINGRLLKQIKLDNSESELRVNVDDLEKGVYFFEIQSSSIKQLIKVIKS